MHVASLKFWGGGSLEILDNVMQRPVDRDQRAYRTQHTLKIGVEGLYSEPSLRGRGGGERKKGEGKGGVASWLLGGRGRPCVTGHCVDGNIIRDNDVYIPSKALCG